MKKIILICFVSKFDTFPIVYQRKTPYMPLFFTIFLQRKWDMEILLFITKINNLNYKKYYELMSF